MQSVPFALQHVQLQDLVFVMTRRCNARCDFCCNDDEPGKQGVLDPAAAIQWAHEFAAYVPDCRSASFTGGEPFLYFSEMLRLHQALAEHHFETRAVTNGYWGKDAARARNKVAQLQQFGLKRLTVSIDPGHGQWIPTAHATTAVKVAVECGVAVTVTSHFNGPLGTAKDYFEPEWHDRITWDEHHYYIPAGRAQSLTLYPSDYVPQRLFCPWNQFVIQPNGDVEPCCSVSLDDGVFVLGNLHRQSVLEVLTNLLGDLYLKLITHRGMHELAVIVRRSYPEFTLPERHHSVCHMCNQLRKAEGFPRVQAALAHYGLEHIGRFLGKDSPDERYGITEG